MMSGVLTPLWIAVAGAMGTLLRYYAGILTLSWSQRLPWGTILINITGSFAIAFFSALTAAHARFPASNETRLIVMAGLCGGYTTFSSFSLQTIDLARDGALVRALLNVTLSVVLCLGATALGYVSAEAVNGHSASIHASPMHDSDLPQK
ncbi:fluoride efflux transporter CrcB [Gluconacetobacter entanii]|uniref:Fluoride-specific ion channel FluC n=1 Tax=Gluconacetobacter entanii TaxID=108528 RepID=A0A318PPS8_9PROT|nr:fluoride efflux transporter CrcB [Gluconacetobacter entanii]MCE2578302.1 fluoride efflux transporter CrcB [Komagataeibacter sp. FNDCR1]PYD62551.1 camphor resistance protein CrcB [Gluconacetobacter entanii]